MPVHLYGQVAPFEQLPANARRARHRGDRGRRPVPGRYPARSAPRVASARSPPRASTRARTSAPTATPAPSSPTTRSLAEARAPAGRARQPREVPARTFGFNSRLDTLQAVVLRAKLRRLAAWNDQRASRPRRYDELLARAPGRASARDAARQRARLAPLRGAGADRDEVLAPAARGGRRRRHPLPRAGAPDPGDGRVRAAGTADSR